MFRPPVNRAMRVLDRSFFKKTVPLAAAHVYEPRNIGAILQQITRSKDILRLVKIPSVQPLPDGESFGKCLLLRPEVKLEDPKTWSPVLQELESTKKLGLVPFSLELDYGFWTYHDIMSSILPETTHDELPTSFTIVGHVAHLNLIDEFLPYKDLIATVLMDKNPVVQTVINKIDDVGAGSVFRTFKYEVLAGEDNMMVDVRHENCSFRFDFAKVYWNSRLQTEHHRLLETYFKPGEAVCDVMAGVGPFAVPAGKKRCFVWANDLNPDSYAWLSEAVKRNNVSHYVRPFNEDGNSFIPFAVKSLIENSQTRLGRENIQRRNSESRRSLLSQTSLPLGSPSQQARRESPGRHMSTSPEVQSNRHHPEPSEPAERTVSKKTAQKQRKKERSRSPPPPSLPPTFSHFVMNLPGSAITFLPSFIGVLRPYAHLYHDTNSTRDGAKSAQQQSYPLPLIHTYTFAVKLDLAAARDSIRDEISKQLGFPMRIAPAGTLPLDAIRQPVGPGAGKKGVAGSEVPELVAEQNDEGDLHADGTIYLHGVRDVAPNKMMYCATFRLPRDVAFRKV
ncbi:MAG: tRNA(m(1)G37)methyltransferase [Chaenotheca gracillima]|nr:MAG: tRNA(m(1)G37)methyltransferase [Chaenotheca gracillima]